MRIVIRILFYLTLINLVGCQHYAGNVVPQSGMTMEQAYDSLGVSEKSGFNPNNAIEPIPEKNLTEIRQNLKQPTASKISNHTSQNFQKLPNPALRLYVYPHLAGNSEIPIPGYYTTVSAYDRDHYGLPNE